jgi:hypothetical protein
MSLYVNINNQTVAPEEYVISELANISGPKHLNLIYPQEAGYFGYDQTGANRTSSFEIGSNNYHWIPSESYFEMDVLLSATGHLLGEAECLVDRIRIIAQDGTILVDDEDHNLFAHVMNMTTSSNENKNLNWQSGRNNLCVADTSVDVLTSAVKYQMIPNLNFWRFVKSVPLPVSGTLRVELTWAADKNVIFDPHSASPTYKVSNLILMAAMLPVSNDYNDKLRLLAIKKGITIQYDQNFRQHAQTLGTNNTVYIRNSMKQAKSLIAVHRKSGYALDYAEGYLYRYPTPKGGISLIQARNGSNSFPYNAITNTGRAYQELLKVLRISDDADSGNQITRARYNVDSDADDALTENFGTTAGQFVVGIDLQSNGSSTGISTENAPLQYVFDAVSAETTLVCDVFVQYGCVWIIRQSDKHYLDK